MTQVNTFSPVGSIANVSGGDPSNMSLQLRFAQLQMALAETAKQGALDNMDAIEQIQKEQQEVAGYLQEARQAQADAKSTGQPTPMSPETQAYMDENGLAYDKTAEKQREADIASCQDQIDKNNTYIANKQDQIDRNNAEIAKKQEQVDKNSQEIQAIMDKYPNKSPVTGMPIGMLLPSDMIKLNQLQSDNANLKNEIHNLSSTNVNHQRNINDAQNKNDQLEKDIAKLETDPISYTADQWDVAITSLKARQDSLGTNTQQMMVYIQDFMGQYNSYLQGANSSVQQSNQTLADLARLR